MPEVQFVSSVIVALGVLLALARLTGLPPSAVVFAGGLASVLLPVPLLPLRTNPEVLLGLLLPPLLYASVASLSVDLLRHALIRGVMAGAVLIIAITLTIALAAHAL